MAIEQAKFFKCTLGTPGMADDREHLLFEVTQEGRETPNFLMGLTFDEAEEFHRELGLVLAKRTETGFIKMTDVSAVRAAADHDPGIVVLSLLGERGGEFHFRLPEAVFQALLHQVQSEPFQRDGNGPGRAN